MPRRTRVGGDSPPWLPSGHRLALDAGDAVGVGLVQRLVLEQRPGERLELVAVGLELGHRGALAFLKDPPHLVELHEKMLHGQAPSAFRSYDSLLQGFQDFAHVLQHQFKSVLDAAKTGDARAFVTALHDSGYSKDYSPAHVPSMASLQAELAPHFASFPSARQVANAAPSFFADVALNVGVAVTAGLIIAAHNEHKRDSRRANRRARREGWLR